MKKLLSIVSLLSIFLPLFEVAKAGEFQFLKTISEKIESSPTISIYGVKENGSETLLNRWETITDANTNNFADPKMSIINEYEGKLYFSVEEYKNSPWLNTDKYTVEYDISNNNLKKLNNISLSNKILLPEGVNQMITKKADGSIHIGKNSAAFKEENGREKFWAQDVSGKSIPIDITNGSKLLINGRDVEQSINNVGALSAALTGLPTVPSDTTLTCGLGTGTHGGDFAFSGGCASKVNEKLSINYAASITMPGQDYAGDFKDQFSARAGFVWKLGKATKPTQISMNDKKVMETKIESLEKKNKTILSKNQKLENKLSILMARLEKIEKIALGESKSKDLAVYKLQ